MLLQRWASILQLSRSFSISQSTSYDVVIVGGGLVGNAMACALAGSPQFSSRRILLLESGRSRSLPSAAPRFYETRVSAVAGSSVDFFKQLGVWDRLRSYRIQPVTDLYVMDSCSQSRIHFEQLNEQTPIAYIVENDAIIAALYDRIKKHSDFANITVESECQVESCNLPTDLSEKATVTLADGRVIETFLLIGADGAKSRVRDAMSIGYTGWDYEQSAVVATLNISTLERPTIAWQRFTPLGPIALLPLSDTMASLVWTTSTAEARRILASSETDFIAELNHYLVTDSQQSSIANKALFVADKICSLFASGQSTELRIPTIVGLQLGSSRAAFSLALGHSYNYIATRAALIGDAAHRLHPLAGLGVNLGWFDVRCLLECLENAVAEGADIGSTTYLSDYDTRSQRHNVPVMLVIDGLKRLYGTEFALLVLLRSLGLHAVNKLLPLKELNRGYPDFAVNMAGRPIITRGKLDAMIESIHPGARLDDDSAAVLIGVFDRYIDDLIKKTVELVKHTGSTTLKKEHVQYVVKHLMPKD